MAQEQPIVGTNGMAGQMTMPGPDNQFLPSGQTAIADLPAYGGSGGDITSAKYYAARDFAQMFGRNPTQTELAQLSAYYVDPTGHVANLAAGQGAIAAYYNQVSQPTALQLQQNQQQSGLNAYQKGATGFNGQINQAFQSLLGRNASDAELQHFGVQLATGQTDPYEIQQYLTQSPEYQQTQYNKFSSQLGGQLNNINGQFFQQYIQPSIMGQFAASGRDVSGASTGLQYALANAAKEMQLNSQQYLAGLGGQAYLGNQQTQAQNYQAQLAQQMGVQNTSLGNSLSNQNALLNGQWGQVGYQQQQQSLMNYLNGMNQSGPSWPGYLNMALNGAKTGLQAYQAGKQGGLWGGN